jgi:uncharacterized protein (DUF2267 family)
VNYKDMTRIVSGRTGLTRHRSDDVIVATLTVLAERLSAEETRDLLAQLPKTLLSRVPGSGAVIEMRPIEFVARVADLVEGVSVDDAEAYVRAVLATLDDSVNAGEMRDIAEELGPDFADLLGRPVPSAPRDTSPNLIGRISRLAETALRLPARFLAGLGELARGRSASRPRSSG